MTCDNIGWLCGRDLIDRIAPGVVRWLRQHEVDIQMVEFVQTRIWNDSVLRGAAIQLEWCCRGMKPWTVPFTENSFWS